LALPQFFAQSIKMGHARSCSCHALQATPHKRNVFLKLIFCLPEILLLVSTTQCFRFRLGTASLPIVASLSAVFFVILVASLISVSQPSPFLSRPAFRLPPP